MEQNAALQSNSVQLHARVAQFERALKAGNTAAIPEDGLEAQDPDSVLGRISLLKQALRQWPQLSIPEMQMLTDHNWLWLIQSGQLAVQDLSSENGLRRALSQLRSAAKQKFAQRLGKAVTSYAKANGGQLPTDLTQLKSTLDSQTGPLDLDQMRYGIRARPPRAPSPHPPVDDATLQRYRVIVTGNVADLQPGQPVIAETAPVDDTYDTLFKIGLNSYTTKGIGLDTGTGGGVHTDPQSMTPEERELHQKALKKKYEEWRLEDLQRANPSIAQPAPDGA
jgi:hypothetical protein